MKMLSRALGLITFAIFTQLADALIVDSARLQANGLNTPLGLATAIPRLSWVPLSSMRNDRQTAFQLQASSESSFSSADLWDTGKTTSDEFSVVYAGKALQSRERAYWRVRLWDAHGDVGAWSDATWFELALMEQSDWTAQWITNTQYVTGVNGLPMFAKEFTAACTPEKARLYILGLGVQYATINGKPVTSELLMPSYSTMNTTLFYNAYDVTSNFSAGSNVLGVELGKGVYDAMKGLGGRYTKFIAVGAPLPLKLIAQLEYTCPDGQMHTIVSDSSWKTTTEGPALEANWYGGWEYDARREIPDAFSPSGNRSNWIAPNVTTSPYPNMDPQLLSPEMPPLRVVETFTCKVITKTAIGSYVFDFGQNFAGWFTFNLPGVRGQRITFWPGERLLSNGSVDQSTTGYPIFDGYTFATNGTETHTPKFMYHGYRFLEVYGLTSPPSTSDILSLRIRFAADTTGVFESNIALFNSIHDIIDQAIQNNMYSVMTDCPHREKMGWLDDDHLAIDPVFFGYDLRGFGRHLMKEMIDAQSKSTGEVPTTAPQLTEFGSWPPWGDAFDQDPNWGISIVLFALKHYRAYGDIEVLSQNYDQMAYYISYLNSENVTSHILSESLGDWEATDDTTPFALTGTSGFAQGVQGLIEVAHILHRPSSEIQKYQALHAEILAVYNTTFLNQTTPGVTTYGSGSQCCDAMSLFIGAVPEHLQAAVYDHLISHIRANGTHFSVGEVCLEPWYSTLTAQGNQELLYQIMMQTTTPSYGWEVMQGATSLTEHWNGMTATGSLDHFMLGYGDTWFYQLAGLVQASTSYGWQDINFAPVIVGEVTYANATFQSVRGPISSAWTLNGDALDYQVVVPVGSMATVILPYPAENVRLDGQGVQGHSDVQSIAAEDGGNQCVIRIGSGTYHFTATK